jgi:hypothetical protein
MGNDAVNAKDLGCKLDGATDDTSALVAAANQASATGRPLYVPAGICVVDNAILPSGLTMFGDGIGLTVFRRKANATASPVLAFANGNAIWLSRFSIEGNKAQQSQDSANLLLTDCSNFHVRDLASSESRNWGILINGTTDSAITTKSDILRCHCSNNGLGIWITGRLSHLTVSENVVFNNDGGGIWVASFGAPASSVTDIVCNFNRVDNNGNQSGGQGLILWGQVASGLGAGFDPATGVGVLPIDRFECSGNDVSRSGSYGMMIQGKNGRVIGNKCYNNSNASWAGIDCTCERTVFAYNECNDNASLGIDAGGCYHCTFVGNVCRNNGATPGKGAGCGLNLGGARYCEASGNILENNGNASDGGSQISLLRYEESNNTNAFPWDAGSCRLLNNQMWVPSNCMGIHVGQDPWNLEIKGNCARNVNGSNAFVIESTSVIMEGNTDDGSFDSPNGVRVIHTNNNVVIIPPHVEKLALLPGNSAFVGDIYTDWTVAAYHKVYAIRIVDGGSGYTDPNNMPTVSIIGGGGSGATATAPTDHLDGIVAQCIVQNMGSAYTSAPSVQISPPPAGGKTARAVAFVSGLVSTQNPQIGGMTLSIQIKVRTAQNPMVFGSNAGLRLAGTQNGSFKSGDYLVLKGFGAYWVEMGRLIA